MAAAGVTVSLGAGGSVAVIAYTWSHPEDGDQDGLLAVGASEEAGGVVGLWTDSWHQSPASVVVAGRPGDGGDQLLSVGYEYAGDWRWRVTIDATSADALRIHMDNIVPASAAVDGQPPGAYAAMDLFAERSGAEANRGR